MSKGKIVYISGPYTAKNVVGVWKNVLTACKVGVAIRKKGHFPLIPHLYNDFDEIAEAMDEHFSWQDYMDMDLAFLERCDALYFIGPSKGANIELQRAKELGLPIYYSLDEVEAVK